MASKCSNCVSETKIATLPLFAHVSYSSLSSIFSVASQTPQPSYSSQSCATPRSHMFHDFPQPAPLVVGAIFSVGVAWRPASCIVGHTRSDGILRLLEALRVEETLCLCSSSSMEEDHLDSRLYFLSSSLPSSLPSPSSTNRLWVYGTRLGKVGRRHIIIEDEEGKTSAAKRGGRGRWWWWWRWRWWRRTNRGYDRLNRFLISPTIHNLSLLSWPTNKKSLNWYCSSVTLALSRSWSKKCDAGRGRDTHRPQD